MYRISHIRSISIGLDSQIWYLFIYTTGYLNVRKIFETIPLVYRLFYFFQNSIDQQVEKVSKAMIPRNILLFKEEKKMICMSAPWKFQIWGSRGNRWWVITLPKAMAVEVVAEGVASRALPGSPLLPQMYPQPPAFTGNSAFDLIGVTVAGQMFLRIHMKSTL